MITDFDEEDIDNGTCEFHMGHSENQKHFQLVISSSVTMNTELTLLALQTFISETREKNMDLYNMGDDFLLVEN